MSIVIKLSDCSPVQLEKIQVELKVHEKQTYFGGKNFYYNKNNFKDDIDLTIYHGEYVRVPYNFGIKLLGYNPQVNIWKNHYRYPLQFNSQLRDYQKQICIEAGKCLEENCTAILNVYASAGKTVMGVYLACKADYLRIIIYPVVGLGKQWLGTIQKFTSCVNNNGNPARVWMVGDEDPPSTPVDFILCPITRVEKIPMQYLSTIGMLIIDEFHMCYTQKRVRELLKLSPKYIVACTATLGYKKEIAHLFCGDKYIFMKSKKPFTVYKFLTGVTLPEKQNKSGLLDWPEYVSAQTKNPIRNEQITGLCVTNVQKKFLLMGWREDHALYLAEELKKMNQVVDSMTGTKKEYQDSRILCGTIGKVGTGFDEENSATNFSGTRIDTLVYLGTMKNEVLIEQTAGRCFRASFPSIIYLVDNNEISHKHWEVAKDWFISRNGTIQEVYSNYATLYKTSLLIIKERKKRIKPEDESIVKIWDGKRNGFSAKKKIGTGPKVAVDMPQLGIKQEVLSNDVAVLENLQQMMKDLYY